MLLRIQDCVSDDPEMEKWAPLTELAIGALRTAGFTLQDMVVDAQVEEEFTAFSRFACLTQSNEVSFFFQNKTNFLSLFFGGGLRLQFSFCLALDCKCVVGLRDCT